MCGRTLIIIEATGQAATVSLLGSARQQGHDFLLLEKPIHPSDLLAAIKKLDSQGIFFVMLRVYPPTSGDNLDSLFRDWSNSCTSPRATGPG